MSHMLRFIEHENTMNLLSNITKRVYELEKTVQALQDFINNNGR
jgi:hypothetical protein